MLVIWTKMSFRPKCWTNLLSYQRAQWSTNYPLKLTYRHGWVYRRYGSYWAGVPWHHSHHGWRTSLPDLDPTDTQHSPYHSGKVGLWACYSTGSQFQKHLESKLWISFISFIITTSQLQLYSSCYWRACVLQKPYGGRYPLVLQQSFECRFL